MGTHLVKNSLRVGAVAVALTAASAASATITVYTASLSGPNEAPPNTSPGTGTTFVTIDDVLNTMRVQVTFSGLVPTTTAGAPSGVTNAHIHGPTVTPFAGTASVATTLPTFPGFPSGVTVTSGTYDNLFNLLTASTYNTNFINANGGTTAGARSAFLAALASGRAYLNIHSTQFPGGEIRGFLVPVPEPATWMMMLIGFGAIGWSIRRRRPSPAAA